MKRLLTKADRLAARYRPADCTETSEHSEGVVFYSPDKLRAIAYCGTAGRPTWHYIFKTADRCDKAIADFFADLDRTAEWRAKRAAASKANRSQDVAVIYQAVRESGRISAAQTAVLIRQRLKREFPGVKFSVTTRQTLSISVDWTDGPEWEVINNIVGNYEFGGFDGSIDMAYHVDRWLYQDGTMSFAYTSGTAGSLGHVDEDIEDPQRGDAVLVTSGPRYLFANRRSSES